MVLPPWCSSPENFIQKHALALESEYVSANMNNWIDLIFGYKQRGQASLDALNVFSNLTYEDHIDIETITDETLKQGILDAVANFGQTPSQLLNKPHPKRLSFEELRAQHLVFSPLHYHQLKPVVHIVGILPSNHVPEPLILLEVPPNQIEHSNILKSGMSEKLISMTKSGLLGFNQWRFDKKKSNQSLKRSTSSFGFSGSSMENENTSPFTFFRDPSLNDFSSGSQIRYRSGTARNNNLCISANGQILYSGGHWDGSVRATNLEKRRMLSKCVGHIDIVTCLALDPVGLYRAFKNGNIEH